MKIHRPTWWRLLSAILLAAINIAGAGAATPGPWATGGQPAPLARQAVAILAAAGEDGLDPADYGSAELEAALAAGDGARLATELPAALARFFADLAAGRIDPASAGERYPAAARPDGYALVANAVASGDLATAVLAARPGHPEYAGLRAALARYRQLAGDPAWREALPAPPDRKLEPGSAWPGLTVLVRRLEALGDLPAGTAVPARYDGALVDGVRRFQRRHGLTPDGVIGKGTLAHLDTRPAERVAQIELALERLRWTPHPGRAVVVNVPAFELHAYAGANDSVRMKVIVGATPRTPTPLFAATMQLIEFSPYWNVPPSIARGETLPKLRRDPAYFDQQGFEFVAGDGTVVSGFSEAGLAAVERGALRIRQRPGGKNALGDIKFIFPNPDHIFLHHTPTPQLFLRDRRDFSHGCIRVEAPVDLARFVLAGQPEWTEERIVGAMTRGRSATLRLDAPLPVIISYRTAAAVDGEVRFYADLYRQDARLAAALRQRSAGAMASGTGRNPS
ncbi:MAG: murein L,D-transpeptidase [Betaproteobacteria bacterium]|nr:murein L,D-transpeptidase [Betaproteobacteria bacterium]